MTPPLYHSTQATPSMEVKDLTEFPSTASFPLPDSPSSFALKASPDHPAARQPQPNRGRPLINYELFVWLIYGTWTMLAIIDRFTWNVWPREIYRIGSGTAGSDFVGDAFFQLKEGPWAVRMYDAVARISGRYCIVALNLVFFSMCHTTYAWLSESWLARYVFDMRDYVEANRRLHKWNGIGIVVMTLLHVWSIIFPCIFHGWHAQVVLGKFEWILSERGPKGFKDINVDTQTMSLQGDDVFRIVEMTILLGILLPFTVRWLATRWHLGVQVHSLIAVLYFIDIVRRHTHPHSWILNTPFFVIWIADLVVGVYWRRHKPEIFRMHLSHNYMLLFWNQERRSTTVGPKYFLKMKESSLLERAHVFTGFENRSGLDLAGGRPWSSCLLVRVYHNKRKVALGRKDKVSHTKRVAEATNLDIITWGPFLGGMSESVRESIENGRLPVTLVAGGSAAGYLIDAVQQHRDMKSLTPLTILYTARDAALIHWVAEVLAPLIKHIAVYNCRVVLALTDGGTGDRLVGEFVVKKQRDVDEICGDNGYDGSVAGTETSIMSLGRSGIRLQHGRINFEKEIPDGNIVFFQGSGGIQKAVERGARARRCRFVAGPSYDNDEKRKKLFLQKLRLGAFDRHGSGV